MHRRLERIFYEVRRPAMVWDDIGGCGEAKKALREMVCLPLAKKDSLKNMGLVPPTGVLMWGPLGTGMTMLPEACAAETGATFVYVSGQEMLGKHDELSEAFRVAEEEAPTVMYISDIDWLVPRPGASYAWPDGTDRGKPPTFADRKLTETLIREIDSLAGNDDVKLLGGCYRIDVVDQAVIKEKSRFNRKIFLPPPTAEDRKEILGIYVGRVPTEGAVDLGELASLTEGYVGWDIENLVKKGGILAVEDGREKVTMKDLVAALPSIRPWLQPTMTEGYHKLFHEDCPHHYHF